MKRKIELEMKREWGYFVNSLILFANLNGD